ncbi:MAG: hypothetical protein SGJ18_00980 [Pseudomonadota bacterium]|nr:hypothetical protein [Pseudomonadota bacterium]
MDSKILNKKKENEEKTDEIRIRKKRVRNEDQFRVYVNQEACAVLETMAKRANEGFDGGEITRHDVATHVVIANSKSFSDSDIKSLRNLNFNERKMLHALLRNSGAKGELPEEIKKALREHYGITEKEKKRSSKNHIELSTEKIGDNSTAA